MSNSASTATGQKQVAEAALEEWHRIVMHRDWDKLPDLLTDDVTYHNPSQFEPHRGKDALVGILKLVFGIFEDFKYLRRFSGEHGYVLEFSARVGDSPLFGVDLIRFNDAGKMTDLVVMLRPADIVAKLGAEAARRMAAAKASRAG